MNAEQIARMIATPYRHVSEVGYDLFNGTVLAWLSCGTAFQLDFDPATDRGADDLTFWWVSGGRRNFPGIREELDRVILQKLHVQHLRPAPASERLALTPLLSLIYRHREDLRASIDIDTASGPARMWYWWLSFGLREYFGSPDWLVAAQVEALHRLDTCFFRKTGLIQPTAMVMLARSGDSQQPIDVETAAGLSVLWQRFLASEAVTFGLPSRGMPFVPDTAPKTEADCTKSLKGLIPPELAMIRISRPDLQAAFGLSEGGVSDLVHWWLSNGTSELPDLRDRINRSLVQSLHLDFLPGTGSGNEPALTPLLNIVRDHRPDLCSAFDTETPDGVAGIWHWWSALGERETFGLPCEQSEQMPLPTNVPGGSAGTATPSRVNHDSREQSIAPDSAPTRANKPGVCLVGYAKAEFGLGEDVRLLRAALDEANIANVVINAPWQIAARQSIDEPAVEAADAGFNCDVMLYVMPPADTVTLLNKIGSRAFSARRKIGFWQWELGRFPVPAKLAIDLVDEIWCHSEHAATAFRQATDKPVIKVPLPVSVPETGIASRAAFGLPEQAFVIFTSFDGASSIARKNPLAAILSFQRAFPVNGSVNARLIVKAMNTNNDPLWRECMRKAAVDERVVIIDTVLDRDVYYQLLRACDAVISLHRAEGFGRLMAEAMAYGIPVIASRYSGNLDFMTDENSWLIDGDLVPLLPGDYAFHQGQVWLEPSVEQAATALRECATDPAKRRRRAALGKADIVSKHGLKTCAEAYLKLLETTREFDPHAAR
jgi:glycosyltransferase involved in cell wall biosynthesis